ncbi:hypothetical protein [Nocardia sp. CA-135398]|uniref:hypothetical protein n=1 Tax=Nocardia sp. CA-135398 TaxID=3239977 RepID=UPI003D98EDE5
MTKTPSEYLAEPSLEDPLNDSFEFLITSNAISPTYWACKWCENVLGTDPLKWFTTKISGDWEALQKAGKAVENLAPAGNAVIPGTRKPNRDRVVTPTDDEDEDDEYFRDRQQRGWLQ